MTRPLFLLAAGAAVLSFVFAGWTSPWANRSLERAVTDMAKTRISAALTAGMFSPWVDDIVVYVGGIDRDSGAVTHVMLADERDPQRPQTIFAPAGRLTTDDEAKLAHFSMVNGTILGSYANPRSYDRTDFEAFELNVSLGTETVESRSKFMEEPRRMAWQTLLASHAEISDPGKRVSRDVEVQRRLAVPFACFLLPLIGVPLGVQQSRAVRSRGLVVGLAVILAYYFLITAGVTLVHQRVVSAPVGLWAPNAVLLVAGVIVFRRSAARRLAGPRPTRSRA